MNAFLKFYYSMKPEERSALAKSTSKGKSRKLLELLSTFSTENPASTEELKEKLEISDSFFDKLCSQLLTDAYEIIAGDNKLKLLVFLSQRLGLANLYYKELSKQKSQLQDKSPEYCKAFFRENINLIVTNLSVLAIQEDVLDELGQEYLRLVPEDKKVEIKCEIYCKRYLTKIHKLFAQGKVIEHEQDIRKEIERNIVLPQNASTQSYFDYSWLNMYLSFASEKFTEALQQLKNMLNKIHDCAENTKYRTLIRLKIAETLYFLSAFQESFNEFSEIFFKKSTAEIPENGYYITKFFQVALAVNNIEKAKIVLNEMLIKYKNLPRESMILRDLLSLIKFKIFEGDYEETLLLLQLGFQKNPKGKIIQYEIELRILETACFALLKDYGMVNTLCNRNIKYLRANGFLTQNSNYPYFFLLLKAITENNLTGKKLSKKLQGKLQMYNEGSRVVYGRILKRSMANAN